MNPFLASLAGLGINIATMGAAIGMQVALRPQPGRPAASPAIPVPGQAAAPAAPAPLQASQAAPAVPEGRRFGFGSYAPPSGQTAPGAAGRGFGAYPPGMPTLQPTGRMRGREVFPLVGGPASSTSSSSPPPAPTTPEQRRFALLEPVEDVR